MGFGTFSRRHIIHTGSRSRTGQWTVKLIVICMSRAYSILGTKLQSFYHIPHQSCFQAESLFVTFSVILFILFHRSIFLVQGISISIQVFLVIIRVDGNSCRQPIGRTKTKRSNNICPRSSGTIDSTRTISCICFQFQILEQLMIQFQINVITCQSRTNQLSLVFIAGITQIEFGFFITAINGYIIILRNRITA